MRYPLVCFDLDGTLVADTVFIWTTLHEHFQTDGQRREVAHRAAHDGTITYEQWIHHDLELLRQRGATRDRILALLRGLRPVPGAIETLAALRRRGHRLAVISGSLGIVIDTVLSRSLFDHILINEIAFDADGTIIGGAPTPFDLAAKADGLELVAAKEGLTPQQCAYVGDNDNDLAVLRRAGLGIAFDPKTEAVAQAAHVVVGPDLRAILPLLI